MPAIGNLTPWNQVCFYTQLTPVTDRHTPVLSEKSLELFQFFRFILFVSVFIHICVSACICMWVCVYVSLCVWVPIEVEERVRSSGSGVPALVSCHVWVLATEPGPSPGAAGGSDQPLSPLCSLLKSFQMSFCSIFPSHPREPQ